MKGPHEVIYCSSPLFLGDQAGAPYADRAAVFWRHDLEVRSNADVLAYAGKQPIAARQKVGKGQVEVFAGTVLGEGSEQALPFWKCSSWRGLIKRLILE